MAGSAAEQFARAGVAAGEAQPRRTAAEILAQVQGQGAPPAPAAAPAPAEEGEGPGLGEAALRGAAQGLTFGFQDEITGALESAFSDKTYKQARDEARAANARAKEAHPWGYGLSEVLGGVATGAGTGGLAAKAAATGVKAVAGLAGAEGALGAAGSSEADLTKGDVGGLAKDTAIGGALGAGVGAGLHKLFGGYVNSAVERRAKHLTEEIGDGAIPTAKRRLGVATQANAQGESKAVEILDADKTFSKALGKNQKAARNVAQTRIDELAEKVNPIYSELDKETGGVPLKAYLGHLDEAIAGADKPGNATIRNALTDVKDDLIDVYGRRLQKLGPEADIDTIMIPTQEVRSHVTRLLKHSQRSIGALNETEAKVVKDEVHAVAHDFLAGHLENVAKATPELAPTVEKLLDANQQMRVYISARDALDKAIERKNWSPQNAKQLLSNAGIPVVGGIIGAGADVVSGGITYGALKGAQMTGKAINRSATKALAGLVMAARSGNVSRAAALDAVRAGAPLATVNGILRAIGLATVAADDGEPQD